MLANFKYSKGGTVISFPLIDVEIDQGSGLISMVLDNGKVFVISEKNIIKEIHTDTSDYFECLNGAVYQLEYPGYI